MNEVVCLGQVLGKCPKCLSDEKNKQCEGYVPITIYTFIVRENFEKKENETSYR